MKYYFIAATVVVLVILIALSFLSRQTLTRLCGTWAAEGDAFCRRAEIEFAVLTIVPLDRPGEFAASLAVDDESIQTFDLTITRFFDWFRHEKQVAIDRSSPDPLLAEGDYTLSVQAGRLVLVNDADEIVLRLFRRYDLDQKTPDQ